MIEDPKSPLNDQLGRITALERRVEWACRARPVSEAERRAGDRNRYDLFGSVGHSLLDLHIRMSDTSLDAVAASFEDLPRRLEPVIADVAATGAPEAATLANDLRAWLAQADGYLRRRLSQLRAAEVVELPDGRALRVGDEEFMLLCSVCGKTATLVVGDGNAISVETLSSDASVPRALAGELFGALRAGGVRALHRFLVAHDRRGVSVFCPDCRRTYCKKHYSFRKELSGTWEVGATVTCPKGHSRELP